MAPVVLEISFTWFLYRMSPERPDSRPWLQCWSEDGATSCCGSKQERGGFGIHLVFGGNIQGVVYIFVKILGISLLKRGSSKYFVGFLTIQHSVEISAV
jgi:hypothetical protein